MNLLSFKMWFNVNPGPLLPASVKSLIMVFFILVILIAAARIVSQRQKLDKIKKTMARKIYHALLWLTFVFLVIFFFAEQGLPILGMRLWFLVLALGGIIWFIFIIRYALIEVPKKEKEKEERERFQKYLPKKKK